MKKIVFFIILFSIQMPGFAHSQHDASKPLKTVDWSFKKANGTFDRAALQRGFQVYKEVCAVCHSMKMLRYGALTGIGLSLDETKVLAAEHKLPAIDDEGQPIQRKALPSDYFVSPYANEKAARAANNGALPPDLTLMTKARAGGADYVYSLLTGYETAPADVPMGQGMHWNPYFPGAQIAMTAPLISDGQVAYADGTAATIDQMAKDVVTFLSWAAEPEMENRKGMGVKVLLYLFAMTLVFYLAKRKIWKTIK